MKPVNQVLYHRAKTTWKNIEQGIAGNEDMFKIISDLPIYDWDHAIPSSLRRTMLYPEPEPLYTNKDMQIVARI